MAAPGPPAGEPFVSTGPTELRNGLFLAGGPLTIFPGRCRAGVPGAGTIAVIAGATGATVATGTVAAGRLATVRLGPGTYRVNGTFADVRVNGLPMKSSVSVTIPAGHTVRQDLLASVP